MECTCGVSNLDTARFCKGCGVAVNDNSKLIQENIKNCHSCNTALKIGALFCNKCGSECLHQEAVLENSEAIVKAAVNNNLHCKFCSAELTPTAKFCLNCGKSCLTPEIAPPIVQSSIKPKSKALPGDLAFESLQTNPQRDNVDVMAKGKNNLTLISILSVGVIAVGFLSWLGINNFLETKFAATPIDALSAQSSASSEPNTAIQAITEPANTTSLATNPITMIEPSATPVSDLGQVSSSEYIGQTVEHGTIVDNYSISLVGKSGAFKVFSVYDSDDSGIIMFTKFILVTDQTGKVITSEQSFDKDSILVDSKSACVINNQPYIGAFALSSTTKELSIPAAIWQVNEAGKLITQDANGIKCGVYLKFRRESDVVESFTGYNDLPKPKPSVQKQSKVNTINKKTQSQQNSLSSKPTPVESNNKPPAPIVQQPEVTPSQPQEKIKAEESKGKTLDTIGGLLGKLGGSIPKGEENHVCTSSERAMNQCQ